MAEIVIHPDLLVHLRAEAAASPDREVCGLLFGSRDRIEAAQPAANVDDDPATGFEIDPIALFAAHRAARNGGPTLIGHYHSHPSGCAIPSERDRAAAEPGKLWLILAGGHARLWLSEHGGFQELLLRAV